MVRLRMQKGRAGAAGLGAVREEGLGSNQKVQPKISTAYVNKQ